MSSEDHYAFGFSNSLEETFIEMPKEEPSRNNSFISAKCDPFYGYSSENASKFLSEFRSYCTLQNLIDDKRTIAAFHLHLRGPALIWFNTLNDSNKVLWTVLQEAFQNRYISRDISDPSFIAESAIFDALTLHPTMAIETFHGQVLEKGSKLDKPERDLTSKFINGLPEQLAFFVRAGNPRCLQDAYQQAKLGEAYGYRTSGASVSVSRPSNADGPGPQCSAAMTQKTGRSEDITSLLGQLVDRMDRLEASMPSRSTRGKYIDREASARNGIVCFQCRGQGHRKSECLWTGSGRSAPNTTCQICQQRGHSAGVCKKLKNSGN